MTGATILFSEMTPDIDWEDRFNKWNDSHYVPLHLAVPGFLSAQRYKDAERENYLAVYELENEGALSSDDYAAIENHPSTETRWMQANTVDYSRYVGNQISEQRREGLTDDPLDAPILYSAFFSVPDEAATEFNAWYTEEHVPKLLECKDWLMCRRFLIEDGEPQPWTHLALHYVADMSAFDSPERQAAQSTEWREKLSQEIWFQSSTLVSHKCGERFGKPA